ncbi:MAG: putative murein peptide carboxypeptidase [Cryomorphaceae bacterium]|nr:MAG: putative murein peptide carboxypeptidase [Cryomorphaceae bacterium]
MIIPEKLVVGDKIGIISTARKITIEELKPPIKTLESWGLKVVLGANLFQEDDQFSGTVDQRTNDLQIMIDDNSIKAILCARGGYGTVQIIDAINFTNLKKNSKWIVGYSDATVLHSHLNNLGMASLHATMPINFEGNTNESLWSLKNALFGNLNNVECKAHPLNKFGKIEGDVVGGNLSILYSLLGSSSDIDTIGKILFIEDLDEYLYHIDRMMMNLKRNGIFGNLKGLIIGGMSDMNDNSIPFGKTAEQIILDYTKGYDFPICFGFPAGHLADNRCLILGINSILEICENGVSLSQE